MIDLKTKSFVRMKVDTDTLYTYVIGDVHGCLDELKSLLYNCAKHAENDGMQAYIVLLGDIIDRGPHFEEIFELIDKYNILCVMGNHEYNFWLERIGAIECRSKARRENHKKFDELSEDRQNMIMNTIVRMPSMVILSSSNGDPIAPNFGECVLTHSPIRNIERVFKYDPPMYTLPETAMRSNPVDFDVAEECLDGSRLFIHGHQSWNYKPMIEQAEEQAGYRNKFFNVDSGVVYGDRLTATCISTFEVIEVEANKVYHEKH